MKHSAIIVAGGSGSRMGAATPKQFLHISGKPILIHTIEAFFTAVPDIQIILVLPTAHFDTWLSLKSLYFPNQDIAHTAGGATRYQSVKNGLELVTGHLVAIHDAVRPLVSKQIILESFEAAEQTGSGVVMVPAKDSIRVKEDTITRAVDRSLYYLVQTPQTFQTDLIKNAFQSEEQPFFTDDASVYEHAGNMVTLVPGDYRNLKITTPEDLLVAEALLRG